MGDLLYGKPLREFATEYADQYYKHFQKNFFRVFDRDDEVLENVCKICDDIDKFIKSNRVLKELVDVGINVNPTRTYGGEVALILNSMKFMKEDLWFFKSVIKNGGYLSFLWHNEDSFMIDIMVPNLWTERPGVYGKKGNDK